MAPHQTIDVKNLCSRNLWELLSGNDKQPLNPQQKMTIRAELLERRHYLTELHNPCHCTH